jgi:hypothetical protein
MVRARLLAKLPPALARLTVTVSSAGSTRPIAPNTTEVNVPSEHSPRKHRWNEPFFRSSAGDSVRWAWISIPEKHPMSVQYRLEASGAWTGGAASRALAAGALSAGALGPSEALGRALVVHAKPTSATGTARVRRVTVFIGAPPSARALSSLVYRSPTPGNP